jgi:hypothetical protein
LTDIDDQFVSSLTPYTEKIRIGINTLVKRKSHRDIVNVIVNGRTGVSYGFVAYAEPPHYVGKPEITIDEWENLLPVAGFSSYELRQNELDKLN